VHLDEIKNKRQMTKDDPAVAIAYMYHMYFHDAASWRTRSMNL
jgi:hypothetical protein